jgi:hypothetical protein|tara:strand:+ start:1474 stop:1656 length:183 start_codon:yes stop_codon:yes gene_type:complete
MEIICKDCGSDEGITQLEFDSEQSYSWLEVAQMTDCCVSCGSTNLTNIEEDGESIANQSN